MDESFLSRRDFFRLVGAGAVTVYLQGCTSTPIGARGLASDDSLGEWNPIHRGLGEGSTDDFSGDRFQRPHAALWDLPRFFAQHPVPPVEAEVPVVIVGGGIGGLISAYSLRDYHPIVLEQADRFGGNAKGESWRGTDYALGSAYFCQPEAGSDLDRLYRAIGMDGHYRVKTDEDPVAWRGEINTAFWKQGGPYKQLAGYLKDCLAEQNGQQYPDMPCRSSQARAIVDRFDHEDFLSHVTAKAGGRLPDSLRALVEHYCWSSLGGSAHEISAAAGVNFLAAEFGPICTAPGGNAAMAERLLQKSLQTIPRENFRPGSLVVKVATDADGALVVYQSPDAKLHTVRAKAVVMACPKFVAARILDGIESKRQAAIKQLTYRSYLVANVLLRKPNYRDFYDLFLLGDAADAAHDSRQASQRQGATDVVFANFASPSRDHAVLTLYRALPYDGARAELLVPGAHQRFRDEFQQQIAETILPLIGFAPRDVTGIRLTRWAHPLPLAKTGIYRHGIVDTLRAPFRERVFFAEQDNWMLPAVESAAHEALTAAEKVTRFLGKPTTGAR